MPSLPELQRAFLRAIAAPDDTTDSSASTDALLAEIVDRGRLGARERVRIYARMYGARLVEALAEDYPRVAAVLGSTGFHELAHAYVRAHPSGHPSLRWFGAHFPEFLTTVGETPGFLVDLARLEWARVTVFDAPDAEILTLEALRRLPADAWAQLSLRLVPAIELLRVDWPVHEIWAASDFGAGRSEWTAGERWLRVWRQGDRVFQAPVDATERIALDHVRAGDDFGTLCEGLAPVVPMEEAASTAGALVLRWIEDEVLHAEFAGS